jgi:hypothetical protein
MKIQSYLLSVLFAFSGFTAQEDPPLFYAEVDIVEGKSLSRLYVFLVNESNTLIEVLTGSSGGAGCFDDRQDEGVGTGIRAIPELLFARSQNQNNFFIRIAPPHLIQGITLRSMQPSFLQIQPKSWIDYYSFDVPSRHIQHDFIQGQIRFESGYKFEGSEKAFLSERIVPILKVNRYPGDSSQLALAILEENLQEECYYFKCRFSPRIKKIVLKNTFF